MVLNKRANGDGMHLVLQVPAQVATSNFFLFAVCQFALLSCHIWFDLKGLLIYLPWNCDSNGMYFHGTGYDTNSVMCKCARTL